MTSSRPTPTPRSVLQVDRLPENRHGARLTTQDAALHQRGDDLDPFLMVSLYAMRGATFPPHPHAGFMVATYILPESDIGFVNQDSLGTHNRIAPGALHVTVAGRGVLHEEQPEIEGRLARGFQIWIDLPTDLREIAPQALSLEAPQVPRREQAGVEVRVVLGESEGHRSPLQLPSEVTLLDVTLAPHASWTLDVPAHHHAFVFMLGGTVQAGTHSAAAGHLLRTRPDGTALPLTAGRDGARFTLFAGPPLGGPRVMQGPFVATDTAQLMRFVRDHALGRFGALQPLSRT